MSSPATQVLNGMKQLILRTSLKFFIVVMGIVMVCQVFIAITNHQERTRIEAIELGETLDVDHNLLIHQLIEIEVDAGISVEPDQAHQKVAAILKMASDTITIDDDPSTKEVLEYFSSIGQLLGKHLYYKRNTTLTQGLKDQSLDCDLRSYLYQAIAEQAGLKTSIVSSPSHAFIAWQGDGRQLSVYWETTSRYGKSADIGDAFYKKSSDPAEYTFSTLEESKDQYAAMLYRRAYAKIKKPELLEKVLALADKRKDIGFIQIQKIVGMGEKIGYDHPDIVTLSETLIETRPNLSKRFLIYYYEQAGDFSAVKEHLGQLDPSLYSADDYLLASKAESFSLKKVQYFIVGSSYKAFERWMATVDEKATWKNNLAFWVIAMAFTIIWASLSPTGLFKFKRKKSV